MRIVKALLAIELLLGAAWTLPLIREGDIGLLGLMLFAWIQPVQLLCMIASIGLGLKMPETRRLAAIAFFTPLGLLFLPLLLRSLFGGPVLTEPGHFAAVLASPVAALLGYCLVLPHRAVAHVPRFLLESRGLNVALALLAALGFAGWVALLVVYATTMMEDDASGIGLGLVGASTVVVGSSSLPIAVYGYIGLFRPAGDGPRRRGLHAAQLILSSLVILATAGMVVAAGIAAAPIR